MNKTDRLLAIVLELQRKGMQRAEDLAATFETSVRTIYRDVQALCEAGVPIIGAPGQGYSLVEGYFLPPVSFTVEEAVTLLIGTEFVAQRFDAEYMKKAEASRSKIEAILPPPIRAEVARVQNTMKLLAFRDAAKDEKESTTLRLIRRALLEGRKVQFHYAKRAPDKDGNRNSFRSAAPYGLVFTSGRWMLLAHCDLRQSLRHFRLSRMSDVSLLDETYRLPADFNLLDYRPPDDRNASVRLLLQPQMADLVLESFHFYLEATEVTDAGIIATLRVRQPEEVLQAVLGWGAEILVLEPESLIERVREEAEKIIKRY